MPIDGLAILISGIRQEIKLLKDTIDGLTGVDNSTLNALSSAIDTLSGSLTSLAGDVDDLELEVDEHAIDIASILAEITAQQTTNTDGAGIMDLGEARTFERVIGANQSYELQNVAVNQFFTLVAPAGSGSLASPFFTHATKTVAIETDGQNWWPGESNGGGGTVAAYIAANPCEGSFKVTRETATHIYVRQNLTNKPTP